MPSDGLTAFLDRAARTLGPGPLCLVMAEDGAEIASTVRHALRAGFRRVILLSPPGLPLPADLDAPGVAARLDRVPFDVHAENAMPRAVNALIDAAPGRWIHWCWNAEYLFHPFCETRRVGEMLAFHAEERREAMLTYVVDLYADDLAAHPDAVSLDRAHLDRTGYYALARIDPATGHPRERQLDFFGGLRWRFEEHVAPARRRIDRIGLFRARPGVRLRPDLTLSDEEMNTYACPWHHNLTAAVCSFRTAKALRTNPGSRYAIDTFRWRNSVPFRWRSQQLMDLGLMEPGQWF